MAAGPPVQEFFSIGEVCTLAVSDIDSRRGLIHIRDGKRGRDRYVMLPPRVLLGWIPLASDAKD